MAGYDPEKDKLIWIHFIEGEGKTEIAFSIYQYGEHPPKVGMARRYFVKNDPDPRFKKLGRVSKAEAERIFETLPLVIEKLGTDSC